MDNNIIQDLINNESDAGSTAGDRQLLTSGSRLSDSDSDSSSDAEEDPTPKPSVHPLPHLTTTAEPMTAMDTSGEEMSCTLIKAINGVEGMDLVLQNVVSSVDMGRELDLKRMTKQCLNSEYNPKKLNAMVVRIREPRTTSLVFKSGKMVVTGARSEHLARVAARKFARIVQHFRADIHFRDFRILNMVAYCDIKWKLELERINIEHPTRSSYEPELFPALIYKMREPKVTFLVFLSGKVVVTGAKLRSQLIQGFNKILPILNSAHRLKQD